LTDTKKTRWFTGRKVITAVGFVTATVMVYGGHMTDQCWVFAMAVFIAGHHAADLIKAWKGG
jgi:hypothetical protein